MIGKKGVGGAPQSELRTALESCHIVALTIGEFFLR